MTPTGRSEEKETAVSPPKPPSLLRWADRRRMPWKNGSGSTREVAAEPAGSGLPDFDWRVSVADVGADGPFSPFPGVDRVITLIDGPAMTLTLDGTEHQLAPLTPFAFPGDSAVFCRLPSGPTRDLNVMTRQGRATASVRMRDVLDTLHLTTAPTETLLALPLTGRLTLSTPEKTPLHPLDTVLQNTPGTLHLHGHGALAEIRINPTT